MFSHKKRIILGMLFACLLLLYMMFRSFSLPVLSMGMIQLFVLPLVTQIIMWWMRCSLVEEVLYMCAYFLAHNICLSLYIFKAANLGVFIGLYMIRVIQIIVMTFLA